MNVDGLVMQEAWASLAMVLTWFSRNHDDVIKWKHFPRYWPYVRGIHRSPVNSPHKGQWREALMFSLICAWINGWVNNREAGDLRCHHTHYDVTVMILTSLLIINLCWLSFYADTNTFAVLYNNNAKLVLWCADTWWNDLYIKIVQSFLWFIRAIWKILLQMNKIICISTSNHISYVPLLTTGFIGTSDHCLLSYLSLYNVNIACGSLLLYSIIQVNTINILQCMC